MGSHKTDLLPVTQISAARTSLRSGFKQESGKGLISRNWEAESCRQSTESGHRAEEGLRPLSRESV